MNKADKSLIYPLFIPMQGCPGRCIYCDQMKISGAGDFDLEAAIIQVQAFIRRNPSRIKEVAFYGGSFTALDEAKRERILCQILAVCDPNTSIRISTHPLYIDQAILEHCRKYRVFTIELGIQDWHDEVLKASGRGYSSKQALDACRLIQDAGFRLGLQLMPGLPGSSPQSITFNHEMLKQIKPQFLRLYPLILIRGTELERIHRQGEYQPLSLNDAIHICADYAELCQQMGIRIIKYGLPSNIDQSEILAGPYHPAFGELVKQELLKRDLKKHPQRCVQLSNQELQLLRAHGCKFSMSPI
ncbi:MAG: radical SAM protein [Candidatus Cloacimonetes bacterium]|nr:radical SAM protein [Candidatus Cloacimonadota bacterium]MDD2684038.1 radical SAM protein [Candidatus Cloacimonadota bacterium]MDD4667524.1 radical SAM protein [Candidatus Cloacimonadota bacterium]